MRPWCMIETVLVFDASEIVEYMQEIAQRKARKWKGF
jgi:hypothetical protein